MQVRPLALLLCVGLLASCSSDKSSNPLSPGVAGPIDGVEISAPKLLLPVSGARIARDSHPVTLVIENAATTGVRPLTHVFEVATDADFAAVILHEADVPAGADGRTTVDVPGPLEQGRTYYWRVRAEDGANTGPHSAPAHFTIFEPFVLAAPSPVTPRGGATVNSMPPNLVAANASRTGSPETVSYQFQVSRNTDFNPLDAFGTVVEQSNQTTFTAAALDASRLYYWRVRAESASVIGPWSGVESFRTPGEAVPPPPSPGLPPSNPGPRPGISEGTAMVAAVIADMRARGVSMSGDCGAFAITRRVAWAFRNRGAGLERKPGGRNCEGHSIDIVIFTDGQTVDMLIGAGDDNGPTWQEHGRLSDWADWWIAPANPD